jgi:hypothetical protein
VSRTATSIMVRAQTLLLNRPHSSFVMEARALQSFTPVSLNGPAQGSLDYRYEGGDEAQLMNFATLSVNCTYGGRYPVSRLNPGLLGEAQEIICDHTNGNGVVADHSSRAPLSHYGVAIPIRNQTAAAVVTFRVSRTSVFSSLEPDRSSYGPRPAEAPLPRPCFLSAALSAARRIRTCGSRLEGQLTSPRSLAGHDAQ